MTMAVRAATVHGNTLATVLRQSEGCRYVPTVTRISSPTWARWLLSVIPELTSDGDLPRGRFCVSMGEVEKRFVADEKFKASKTRAQVWSDFNDLLDLIRRKKVRVPAAFLGGSFVTNKADPSDVDAALIIDMSRISNPATIAALKKIVQDPKKSPGLKVDALVIQWHPDGTENGGNPSYFAQRGKWDDFWQRKVAKANRVPSQRSHAMPVRGYLEVIIDGYS